MADAGALRGSTCAVGFEVSSRLLLTNPREVHGARERETIPEVACAPSRPATNPPESGRASRDDLVAQLAGRPHDVHRELVLVSSPSNRVRHGGHSHHRAESPALIDG
jgi:hypothetical protein